MSAQFDVKLTNDILKEKLMKMVYKHMWLTKLDILIIIWKVNEYGFIGLKDVNHDNQILIIGDSMIENIMNPIECNWVII